MALVGGFEVAGIVSGAPPERCKEWQPQSGAENENFLHNFQGATTAYDNLIGLTRQFPSLLRHLLHLVFQFLNLFLQPPRSTETIWAITVSSFSKGSALPPKNGEGL